MQSNNHFHPPTDQAQEHASEEGIRGENTKKDPDSLADGSGSTTKSSDSDQGQEDGEKSFSAG